VKIAKAVDDTSGVASNEPIKPDDQLKLTEEVIIHNLIYFDLIL